MSQQKFNKIVLLGYMASGKSSIGKLLAKQLGYAAVDLDERISAAVGQSIPEFFTAKGELAFRKYEHQQFKKILDEYAPSVISLGGGTPCYFDHMELLSQTPQLVSVYLNVALPVLVARLENEKAQRPLIAHLENTTALTNFVGKHLFERSSFYAKATHQLSLKKETPQEIVTAIEQLIG